MLDFEWAVPWVYSEVVNTIFLGVATLVVIAVPIYYGAQANLRDPLARAILYGTSVTGIAFLFTFIVMVAFHAGFHPDMEFWNWTSRATYTAVAIGKGLLLVALVRIRREVKHSGGVSRNQDEVAAE